MFSAYFREAITLPGGDNSDKNSNDNQHNEFGKALSVLSQMGVTIIVCIAVGLAAGYFLDKFLGTAPWLLLVFTLLGIAAAFKSIFDFAKKQ